MILLSRRKYLSKVPIFCVHDSATTIKEGEAFCKAARGISQSGRKGFGGFIQAVADTVPTESALAQK